MTDEDLRGIVRTIQENCMDHLRRQERIETHVSGLRDDMKEVNTFLVKGGGHSISERLVILETKHDITDSKVTELKELNTRLDKKFSAIQSTLHEVLNQNAEKAEKAKGERARLLFWSPIIVSLIALITSVIALLAKAK